MVVIDTSVAYKWFSSEKEALLAEAIALLENADAITAPDLLVYELTNAWATKSKLKSSQIEVFLADFKEIKIKLETVSFELISLAISFSKKHGVSVYDASYAVLAQKNSCNLYTADSKFVSTVNLPFVKHLSDYQS